MRKEMRRNEREISKAEALEILENGRWGTLAVNGDDGYPYAVPVNYCMCGENVLFHSAEAGYKFDSIKKDEKVSFSVVLSESIVAKDFTSNYESVIVFGKARFIEDEAEKKEKLMALIKRHHSEYLEEGKEYIDRAADVTAVIEIIPEHISGKRNAVV